jgi:hypothetical protein
MYIFLPAACRLPPAACCLPPAACRLPPVALNLKLETSCAHPAKFGFLPPTSPAHITLNYPSFPSLISFRIPLCKTLSSTASSGCSPFGAPVTVGYTSRHSYVGCARRSKSTLDTYCNAEPGEKKWE